MKSLARYLCVVVAGLALSLGARAASDVNEAPVLLVAKPSMGAFYGRTVLLVRPIGGGRHIGFIVNRPTRVKMDQLFPEHQESTKLSGPVFLGGPVHMDVLFALVRSQDAVDANGLAMTDDLKLVMDARAVDKVVKENRNDLRIYAGLVAWMPGELQMELERGFWYVVDQDPALVMRASTEGLWEELVARSRPMV